MFIRKRCLLALGAALAAGVLAAVALGQEVIPVQIAATVKVRPDTAGTPNHPRCIQVVAHGTIDTPGDAAPLMPRSVDVWLPKGWVYNGAKHPACARSTLMSSGPNACPPGSIMSHGVAYAQVVDITSRPHLTVVNGGQTKVHFWVVVTDPARIQTAVTGTITKLSSPRWSYRLHADIPSSLQIVANIPSVLESFDTRVGRGDWIATTGCPRDQRWRYHVEMTYPSGQVVATGGSVTCRR